MRAKSLQKHKNKEVIKTSPLAELQPPKSVKDCRRILSLLISGFIKGEIQDQKAKTLCYLLNSYVMIVTTTEFEERLRSIEEERK